MKHTLVAAFDNYSEAEIVKTELMSKGISQTDISLAASNTADATGDTLTGTRSEAREVEMGGSRDDETVGDKISDFFKSLFGNDSTDSRYADSYPEAVRRGSTVMTVVVDDALEDEVVDIMERNGAFDIDERSASWSDDASGTPTAFDASAGMGTDSAVNTGMTTGGGISGGTGKSIPVMEEELKVGKRERNNGRVRVVSHITERPVEETVSLREKHADIQRTPVDRAASPDELSNFKEGSFEIQETAEEPVVEKTARVVEEVRVGTETTQHEETIRDNVRKTDVDIERDGTGRLDDGLTEKKY
ncbi:YsnF/AvaK domain-containing protein [Stutzerimonas tarimensis]|uniref:YsnF/AvaK domain-containing protein n=1 Tax=Stutzerimonas tarimensis TaxID=1507735 RepID=A0ABV7T6V3_9GAMM